jgi:hypothetical protein
MTVFARIDHARSTEVGLSLRPTKLLIFGNARTGTPLMQLAQTIGIDREGAGLAGRIGRHVAFVQRPKLSRETAQAWRRSRPR